jgi:Fuseless
MTTVVSITIFAIVALMTIRALRNVMAPPFVLVTDHSKDYFDIPTMYKKSVSI